MRQTPAQKHEPETACALALSHRSVAGGTSSLATVCRAGVSLRFDFRRRRGFGGSGGDGGAASSRVGSDAAVDPFAIASYPEDTRGAHCIRSGEISRTLQTASRAAKQAWVTDGIKHSQTQLRLGYGLHSLQHRLLVPKLLEIHRLKDIPPNALRGDVWMMGASVTRWTSTHRLKDIPPAALRVMFG